MRVTTNQIQQWKQEDPHDIDEVPVQAEHFDRRIIVLMEATPSRHKNQRDKNRRTDNHVQCMHTGHGKVKAIEDLHMFGIADRLVPLKAEAGNMMMMEFVAVLDHLDAEKDKAEKESEQSSI